MKRILLLTTVSLLIFLTTKAQIPKGMILLGGNVSGTTSKSTSQQTEYKSSNISVSPSIGLTYKENNVIGSGLSYGHLKVNYDPNRRLESNNYGVNLYYRRYFTLGQGFHLFGQTNAGSNFSDSEEDTNINYKRQKTKQHSLNLSLYPGLAYLINNRFQLEVGLGNLVSLNYNRIRMKTESFSGIYSETRHNFLDSYFLNQPLATFSVGFRITLGAKQTS